MKFKLLFIFSFIFSSLPLWTMHHYLSELDKKLAEAIIAGNIKQTELCLLHGANPNIRIKLNPWELTTPLIFAAEKGYINIVKFLLDHHADVNAQSETGWTSLMSASCNGHVKIVKLLLNRHANVNLINKSGETALHYASRRNHSTIINMLLKHGSDITIMSNGESALVAAKTDDAIELFLKHINHILDKTDSLKIYQQWDWYIFCALNIAQMYRSYIQNAFRMLLHHADKLPRSRKKIESLIAKKFYSGFNDEKTFGETIKHLRTHAF